MEKHYYPGCNDLDLKNLSFTRCCSHKCNSQQCCHDKYCCSCHYNHCRKNLCDTDFSIRLGGLQDGLNFRLRQLLWCEAEFELDNGNTFKGTIVSAGSNFVEVLVEDNFPLKSGEHVEEEDMDNELTVKRLEEDKNELAEEHEERKHKKGKSWIFSNDKIASFKVDSSYHCGCTCN